QRQHHSFPTRRSSDLIKENDQLAYNTSLFVHGIYGLRSKNKEHSSVSEFGLKTWWMTNQSRVLKHTVDLVRKERSQFIMRPEFLLNFLSMSPTSNDARESFNNIFPSVFGIQLGHRLKDDVFHNIMNSVRSEERRVGKECRMRWSLERYKK